ncbi:adenosylcobinamide-GDP ribazoletransferase [Selenomonas sp. TAMA-11512]|uniref:adenosylcobinamide-GDP ribazoletransferase n=1 Tax=Selenomonas sp. TAMA-11512 TaxID=3095337 RepID=UPI00308F2927|nr:adenosylcobinamide-GDP ribazoletransferase [Selenomonas sp. TAMA-11512]
MRAFLVGLQFLTRIHVVRQDDLQPIDFSKSVRYFPLVGLLLGVCYAILAWCIDLWMPRLGLYVPENAAAFLLASSMILLTGGIHCDGLMDTLDGILSGRSRERMLEIMKDSRVGTYGIVGFVLFFFAEYVLLLDMGSGLLRILALFFAPYIARVMLVFAICAFPYARPEGMGKAFCEGGTKRVLLSAFLFLPLVFFLGIYVFSWLLLPNFHHVLVMWMLSWGTVSLLILLSVTAMTYFFCRHVSKLLGGLTGDVYGATVMLSELLTLALFLLLPRGTVLF